MKEDSATIVKEACVVGMTLFIRLYKTFSNKAFGPPTPENNREAGIIDHIKKELKEIQKADTPEEKMNEWVDIILLGIDGAGRTGCTSAKIAKAVWAKYQKNLVRSWPDWRTVGPDKAVQHKRGKHD